MNRPLRLVPQAARPVEFCCPLCKGVHAGYIFGTSQFRIYRCGGCSLTFSEPHSRRSALPLPSSDHRVARGEEHHSSLLAALASFEINGPVIVFSDSDDGLVDLLERRGVDIDRHVNHDSGGVVDQNQKYKAAIVTDALMRAPDPKTAMARIRNQLVTGSPLFLSLPLLDCYQARLMGRNWHEWQLANSWYFTRETVNLLLLSVGFEKVWFQTERRRYSLDTLATRLRANAEAQSWLRSLDLLRRVSPETVRRRPIPLPSGTNVVTAVAAATRATTVVSIIVPVFNERATFETMMETLLAKQLAGMSKEIIVVESNSTDGTRELAQQYAAHPEVKLVLQAGARGKGHAVREGLDKSTGDIVLIQDADLEYDLDDYDGLLAPLANWQAMFILGSRHTGGWKMRKFNDAPLTAAVFNFGHWVFKTLINMFLNTRMTDPFTMFKIFRRDALHGINFECNRFDFDIELVMMLVRKGYVPIEIPVNYTARSFAEGKKVSMTKDGMTWVWTILKTRFSPMGVRHPGHD